ncbi:tRNA (adenine(58)-N(1))-methyltransferase non-catalytic subunit TRM6-like [Belonocnema kinseyi]|uniref:tRNA (adenine(58)-N(1))-methyltransferase non-catalytic subunit TRM6-like n=1 Tax=Belonocnema kinseyi TaxID=2817044 RepID=UPI00143D07F5|nr:tRNA (adenine(58)-N(1))-methyltransferase non-catalytic subunit TRM6-like [Belonocnema kinseyi]
MHKITNCLVRNGDYVIVKKNNFKKVHKVSERSILILGKEQIETKCIVGKEFWTTFEVIPSENNKEIYTLLPVIKAESLDKLNYDLPCGLDNRSINDDGTSQQLTKDEILGLRKAGKSSREIVSSLIENSSSFCAKTEYSQQKYIRKKEKKYFQYLTICRPTIELLHEIYFHQDYTKISCLRVDTLAQTLSYCDIKSAGMYLLYDSGSSGLPAASILNRIGSNTDGSLLHIHPGSEAQMAIIHAMNFPEEQLNRLHNISITKFIKRVIKVEIVRSNLSVKTANSSPNNEIKPNSRASFSEPQMATETSIMQNELKRKNTELSGPSFPKKESKISDAMDHLKTERAEALVVIAREHPRNLIEFLIPFLKKSRPFVIYHSSREPLQDTYVLLKQKFTVVNLKLFSTFLRSYQVLTDRTHPDIVSNNQSGYILTGYLV